MKVYTPIVAGVLVALAGGGFVAARAAGPLKVKVNVPAAAMKGRVHAFRDNFERDYLASRVSLPVYTLLHQVAAEPAEISAQQAIATRKDGSARQLAISEDGTKIVSEGNAVKGVVFTVLMKGDRSKVEVDFPAHLEAKIETTKRGSAVESLRFEIAEPIKIKLNGLKLGLQPPDVAFLRSILIDESRMTYEVWSAQAAPSTVYEVNLQLDKTETK